MNPPKTPVAALQMVSGADVAANLSQAERLVQQAVAEGAKLVVLPENFGFMGLHDEDVHSVVEVDGAGRMQDFLGRVAREQAVTVVGGTVPLRSDDPGRVSAACLVFGPDGSRLGRYDKIHLFDVAMPDGEESYAESDQLKPGSEPVVVETDLGSLGLVICYDLRFPELFRRLLDAGATLFALPAAFTLTTGLAHWEPLLRARAIENQAYLIAAAQGGRHSNGRDTFGHSMIIDPWGRITAEHGYGPGVVLGEVDAEAQWAIRGRFPTLGHRRFR